MSRDLDSEEFRITGYGVDGPPPCFGSVNQPDPVCQPPNPAPAQNADNRTQQTHLGGNNGEVGTGANVRFEYEVDTQGGSSGSPIIVIVPGGDNIAVGIHTTGGCSATGGENFGTSFENDNLESALRDFSGFGADVRHLDNGHLIDQSLQDGTIFRPFDALAEAVDSVPAGGLISIVAGTYAGFIGGTIIDKPMTLRAPVGTVTLLGDPGTCGDGICTIDCQVAGEAQTNNCGVGYTPGSSCREGDVCRPPTDYFECRCEVVE